MNCHKHNLVPSELDRLSAINYCSSRTKLPTLPSLKTLKRTKPKNLLRKDRGFKNLLFGFGFDEEGEQWVFGDDKVRNRIRGLKIRDDSDLTLFKGPGNVG